MTKKHLTSYCNQSSVMFEILYEGKLPIQLFLVQHESTIPHLANKLKIYRVLEGEYIFHINATNKIYNINDIVIVRCGTLHSFKKLTEVGELEVLYIDVDTLGQICDYHLDSPVEIEKNLFHSLLDSVQHKDELWTLSILARAMRMLYSDTVVECDNKAIDVVSHCIEYMTAHCTERVLVKDIANELHMNDKQLMRLFKKVTGYTVLKYLTVIRLNASLTSLHDGKTIVETALSNGFPDSKSYHKNFKEYFNMTPKEYRLKHLK